MAGGTSYNGWACNSNASAIDVDPDFAVAGVTFPGGVRGGDVETVLGYVCTQLHERVEAVVAGWCWGYEYRENVNDPGSMSCHASATAVDYNAPNHGNGGSQYEGFNSDQVAEIRKILAEIQQSVQWGADYSGTKDPMHFEIIVDADTLAGVAASLPGTNPPDEDDMTTDEHNALMECLTVMRRLNANMDQVTTNPDGSPLPGQTNAGGVIRDTYKKTSAIKDKVGA